MKRGLFALFIIGVLAVSFFAYAESVSADAAVENNLLTKEVTTGTQEVGGLYAKYIQNTLMGKIFGNIGDFFKLLFGKGGTISEEQALNAAMNVKKTPTPPLLTNLKVYLKQALGFLGLGGGISAGLLSSGASSEQRVQSIAMTPEQVAKTISPPSSGSTPSGASTTPAAQQPAVQTLLRQNERIIAKRISGEPGAGAQSAGAVQQAAPDTGGPLFEVGFPKTYFEKIRSSTDILPSADLTIISAKLPSCKDSCDYSLKIDIGLTDPYPYWIDCTLSVPSDINNLNENSIKCNPPKEPAASLAFCVLFPKNAWSMTACPKGEVALLTSEEAGGPIGGAAIMGFMTGDAVAGWSCTKSIGCHILPVTVTQKTAAKTQPSPVPAQLYWALTSEGAPSITGMYREEGEIIVPPTAGESTTEKISLGGPGSQPSTTQAAATPPAKPGAVVLPLPTPTPALKVPGKPAVSPKIELHPGNMGKQLLTVASTAWNWVKEAFSGTTEIQGEAITISTAPTGGVGLTAISAGAPAVIKAEGGKTTTNPVSGSGGRVFIPQGGSAAVSCPSNMVCTIKDTTLDVTPEKGAPPGNSSADLSLTDANGDSAGDVSIPIQVKEAPSPLKVGAIAFALLSLIAAFVILTKVFMHKRALKNMENEISTEAQRAGRFLGFY